MVHYVITMKFEFVSGRELDFMPSLARALGSNLENFEIRLPAALGKGYIKMLDAGHGVQLVLHRYTLTQELIFKRLEASEKTNLVNISFNVRDNPFVFLQSEPGPGGEGITASPVHITSTNIHLETYYAPGKNIHTTNVLINTDLLLSFLETKANSNLLKTIASHDEPFSIDSAITPRIISILTELDLTNSKKFFDRFYYRIKAQELIYLLFEELLKEESGLYPPLHSKDIEKMSLIRDLISADLSTPPVLAKLAKTVCMCETKMKKQFRQVFGKSIYNYFQIKRMEEAGRLLREFSVSETSHRLGFVNPSYFSQVFEKYSQTRPKKFKNRVTQIQSMSEPSNKTSN
jgi:AraC-like DNA-binding protein